MPPSGKIRFSQLITGLSDILFPERFFVFLRLFDSPVSLQFNLFRGSSEHPINECYDALRGAFQCCKVALDLLLQSVKLYLDFLISAFPSVSVLSCFFQIVFELIASLASAFKCEASGSEN